MRCFTWSWSNGDTPSPKGEGVLWKIYWKIFSLHKRQTSARLLKKDKSFPWKHFFKVLHHHLALDDRWQWVYLIAHFAGSFQSSEIAAFLNEGESSSSKTMRWKWISCIGAHFLRPRPCYPIVQESSPSLPFGRVQIQKRLCDWKRNVCFLLPAQTGLKVSVREPAGHRVKVVGAWVQLCHLCTSSSSSSEAGTVWLCVLLPNVFRFLYKLNKTPFVSKPGLFWAKKNKQTKQTLYSSPAMSLILTSWSVLVPKSTSTIRGGAQVELQPTNFT